MKRYTLDCDQSVVYFSRALFSRLFLQSCSLAPFSSYRK